jgi:hypothetical protein
MRSDLPRTPKPKSARDDLDAAAARGIIEVIGWWRARQRKSVKRIRPERHRAGPLGKRRCKMRKHVSWVSIAALAGIVSCFVAAAQAGPVYVTAGEAGTVSFTAGDIKAIMAAHGVPLHNDDYQYGISAIRAMPIVGGSHAYTINGLYYDQLGWDADFLDSGGNPAGLALFCDDVTDAVSYMIIDLPWDTFPSGVGGANPVVAVDGASVFSFDFWVGDGGIWAGSWQFVVDGAKYTRGTPQAPSVWLSDFHGVFSGTGVDGPIGGNFEIPDSAVPEPITALGIFLGLASLGGYMRRRRMA